jgi:hypothetical protein
VVDEVEMDDLNEETFNDFLSNQLVRRKDAEIHRED